MKARRFEIVSAREVDASPDVVISRIQTPSTWPEWQSEILSTDGSSRLSEGDVVRGDAKLLGFRVEGHSTSLEVTEDSFVHDVIVGVRMQVAYTVEPSAGGARIVHRLYSDLPRGVAGSVLSFLLRWRLKKMQRMLLGDLVRQTSGRRHRSSG